MLTPPDLPDSLILERLAQAYGLHGARLAFLPLGADVDTALYRVESSERAFFLKLRRGAFNPISVELPAYLHQRGQRAIIAPLPARSGQAWASLDEAYTLMLYPFIAGRNAYQQVLSEAQWRVFGAALRALHDTQLPAHLSIQLPRETFPAQQREAARAALRSAETSTYRDPVAAELAADLRKWRGLITHMLDRTNALASALRANPPAFVLCHADVHPGNLHLACAEYSATDEGNCSGAPGSLYLVDWDAPLYAPKERDLLLIGGSATWHDPREEALFYEGYGPNEPHPAALVYYRYQRVIEDIAAYCQQLLGSDAGGDDRPQSLRYFRSSFQPGGEIEQAVHTDRRLIQTGG